MCETFLLTLICRKQDRRPNPIPPQDKPMVVLGDYCCEGTEISRLSWMTKKITHRAEESHNTQSPHIRPLNLCHKYLKLDAKQKFSIRFERHHESLQNLSSPADHHRLYPTNHPILFSVRAIRTNSGSASSGFRAKVLRTGCELCS